MLAIIFHTISFWYLCYLNFKYVKYLLAECLLEPLVSYFQNEWNALTSTDYKSYKDYRSDIQYAINNKLKLLTFECWNERKVNAKRYEQYLKILRATEKNSQ